MTEERDDDPTDKSHPLYDPKRDPTHESYEGDSEDSVSHPDLSEEKKYKIGPGFPPNESKWKEGCPSPNPKGRPRNTPTMKPDFKKALEAGLNEKVVITRDKRQVVLTKGMLGIQQLVNQFAKGDKNARRDLFKYAAQLGIDLQAKNVIEQALGITDQAALDDYVRRRYKELSAEVASQDHVKAPPDLIDDDVTNQVPDETPVTSPQPVKRAKKPAEPILDEHGKPMLVSDSRYVQHFMKRELAKLKKDLGES
jgi:hypothetical protein